MDFRVPLCMEICKELSYNFNVGMSGRLEYERLDDMKKVKITVLKTTFDKKLAEEYGAEGLTVQ